MKPVTVYTKALCPFCVRAMSLLNQKGAEIVEISAGFDSAKRQEMVQKSGGRNTFPQIFIGDHHVGGCDDLNALERRGALDALLAD